MSSFATIRSRLSKMVTAMKMKVSKILMTSQIKTKKSSRQTIMTLVNPLIKSIIRTIISKILQLMTQEKMIVRETTSEKAQKVAMGMNRTMHRSI